MQRAITLVVLAMPAVPLPAQQLVSRTGPADVLLIGVHAVDDQVIWASGQKRPAST